MNLQREAGDYKEMMATLLAMMLCFFHAARTLWGLMQLKALKNWTVHTYEILRNGGFLNNEDEEGGDGADAASVIDREMLVNNTLIDNEFSGADISVNLRMHPKGVIGALWAIIQGQFEEILSCSEPEVSTVRWATTFLCRFGAKLTEMHRQDTDNLAMMLFRHIAIPRRSDHVGLEYCFPLSSYLGLSAYSSPRLKDDHNPLFIGNQKFTLEGVTSGYRQVRKRKGVHDRSKISIEHVVALGYLTSSDGDGFLSVARKIQRSTPTLPSHGWNVLASQMCVKTLRVGNALESAFGFLPRTIRELPAWDSNSNCCLLQTSIHLDRISSQSRHKFFSIDNSNMNSFEEYKRSSFAEMEANAFLHERDTELERAAMCRPAGCGIERTRTLLARWLVEKGRSSNNVNWLPPIDTTERSITLVHDIDYHYQLQRALQMKLDAAFKESDDLPAKAELIIFFMLSYPGKLQCEREILENGVEIVSFTPVDSPQHIGIRVNRGL